MNTIVVGIDGSPGSIKALEFAIAEARVRQADVKAVTAWHVPLKAYDSGWVPIAVNPHDYELIGKAAQQKAIDEAAVAESDVPVVTVLREGQAADVLVDEA